MKSFSILAAALLCTFVAAPFAHAQKAEAAGSPSKEERAKKEKELIERIEKFGWRREGAGKLGAKAEVAIPKGYRFTSASGTQQLLKMYNNIPSGTELGMLTTEGFGPWIIFEFNDSGYVKDDDKDSLNADELMKQLRAGNAAGNEQRREMGIGELELIGWAVPPRYNAQTNNLEWATRIRSKDGGGESINYNTKLLGRKGVMEVALVCAPEEMDKLMPEYQGIMAGYKYLSGESYAEYRAGDKVAQYGLAALVAGGAAVAAGKMGLFGKLSLLFAKLGKGIIVVVIAVGAVLKTILGKLFGKKSPGGMTDGQLLFAVFAALYLVECLRWIPAHSWICVGRTGGRWRFRHPSKNFAARGIGTVLLAPLPPFRAHFVAMPWIFVPERDHLVVRDDNHAATRIAWDKLKPHAEGSIIILDGLAMARMPSPSLASEWCDRLREWAAMPEDEREKSFLDHAARSLDAEALKETAAALTERTRLLHANAGLILVWCFGVVSGIYAWYGETPRLWIALLVLLGLQITQAILFWRATRHANHESRVPYRFWKALSAALMPQHSVRAADHICRSVTRVPHPLAARLLVDPVVLLIHARRFWREARFQKGWQAAAALPLEAVALDRFFTSSGTDIATLEEPPARDTTSVSYCPRCLAQFQLAAGECLDCEGVELRAFPPAE